MRTTAEELVAQVHSALADDSFVKLVFSGRVKGRHPAATRVDLRPVLIGGKRQIQSVTTTGSEHLTANFDTATAEAHIDGLLESGYANVTLTSKDAVWEFRVTKGGDVFAHRTERASEVDLAHDRSKTRMLDPADPLLVAVGVSTDSGQVKAKWRDKHRQVDDFLRIFSSTVTKAISAGQLPEPTAERPLSIVDLGCGHAYLTFGAQAWMERVSGWPSRIVGVDVKAASMQRNQELSDKLGVTNMRFVASGISEFSSIDDVDVVLALHACDTATDDALAWAVRHNAKVILSVPCCHHALQPQLAAAELPQPLGLLTKHGILRERFADLVTDAARAALLRQMGYRVDVIEFVSSEHTPRNLMIRAVRTDVKPDDEVAEGLDQLGSGWRLTLPLGEALVDE